MAASLLILHDVNGTAARIVSDMFKQIMQGDFAICYLGNVTGIMVRVLSLFLAYAEAILVVEVAFCNDKCFNPFRCHQRIWKPRYLKCFPLLYVTHQAGTP
jgi:hypothetical protein